MNEFVVHIVSSAYTGEAGTFDLEKNYFRVYKDANRILSKNQLLQIGKIVQKEIINYCNRWKWKNIANAIILTEVNPTELLITVESSQMQKAKWLHYGTERHWVAPRIKKVLHWITQSGEDAYSKGHWVSGIIAHDFFKLNAEARTKVEYYLNNIFIFNKH